MEKETKSNQSEEPKQNEQEVKPLTRSQKILLLVMKNRQEEREKNSNLNDNKE
jgi:predicted GIY-YIG superfamily endonuclease